MKHFVKLHELHSDEFKLYSELEGSEEKQGEFLSDILYLLSENKVVLLSNMEVSEELLKKSEAPSEEE